MQTPLPEITWQTAQGVYGKIKIRRYGSNQVAAQGSITANEMLQVCGSDDSRIIAVGFDSDSVLNTAVTDGTIYGAATQVQVSISW